MTLYYDPFDIQEEEDTLELERERNRIHVQTLITKFLHACKKNNNDNNQNTPAFTSTAATRTKETATAKATLQRNTMQNHNALINKNHNSNNNNNNVHGDIPNIVSIFYPLEKEQLFQLLQAVTGYCQYQHQHELQGDDDNDDDNNKIQTTKLLELSFSQLCNAGALELASCMEQLLLLSSSSNSLSLTTTNTTTTNEESFPSPPCTFVTTGNKKNLNSNDMRVATAAAAVTTPILLFPQKLSLTSCGIGPTGVSAIFSNIPYFSSLKILDLSRNNLRTVNPNIFLQCIPKMIVHVQELYLSATNLNESLITALLMALRPKNHQQQQQEVLYNNNESSLSVSFASSPSSPLAITILDISNNFDSLESLLDCIVDHLRFITPSLKKLILAHGANSSTCIDYENLQSLTVLSRLEQQLRSPSSTSSSPSATTISSTLTSNSKSHLEFIGPLALLPLDRESSEIIRQQYQSCQNYLEMIDYHLKRNQYNINQILTRASMSSLSSLSSLLLSNDDKHGQNKNHNNNHHLDPIFLDGRSSSFSTTHSTQKQNKNDDSSKTSTTNMTFIPITPTITTTTIEKILPEVLEIISSGQQSLKISSSLRNYSNTINYDDNNRNKSSKNVSSSSSASASSRKQVIASLQYSLL